MQYQPKPLNTANIQLPTDVAELIELLAKNNHEVWALQRISDGWKYGPTRNDLRKEHPSIIPYEDLSEEEKKYDRIAAIETIKVIVSLGYRIYPPQNG